jgi:hypothetical protein
MAFLSIAFLGSIEAHALTVTAGAGACVDAMDASMDWGSISNAQGTPDGLTAAVDLVSMGTSNRIHCSSYGFNLPANAIINGITLDATRYTDSDMNNDGELKLLKAGVLQTQNKADLTFWPQYMFFLAGYGGSSDLWGTTWTRADINDPGFGAALSVKRNDGASGAFIDSLVITVDYIEQVPQAAPVLATPFSFALTVLALLGGGIFSFNRRARRQ